MALLSDKKVNGVIYAKEEWHEYLRGRFLGSEELELPNGKTVTRTLDTHNLPVNKFNDYMHEVEAWAIDHGVHLDD